MSTFCRARARFSVPGCSRGSQGGSLRATLLVPGCFEKQPGKVGHSFPFLPPFFRFFILTMYLGSMPTTRSSQGGQLSDVLVRRGFQPLAASAAARGAVYSVQRLARVVFGTWLLCEAARDGLPFLSLPPSFFSLIYTNSVLRLPGCYAKQPGESTVLRARRVRFSARGCLRGSQGGLFTVCLSRRVWFSVPGCFAKQLGGSTVCRVRRARSFVSFSVFNEHR